MAAGLLRTKARPAPVEAGAAAVSAVAGPAVAGLAGPEGAVLRQRARGWACLSASAPVVRAGRDALAVR